MNQNALSLGLISIGTVLIIAAGVLLTLVATGFISNGGNGNSELRTVVGVGSIATPTVGPSPTPAAKFPTCVESANDRLAIPNAKIDAPVVTKGVDEAGVMQAPDVAYDTAWYDFSSKPGFDGNAVFAR